MNELYLFAKGLIVGFGISIPVGPIGILCIRRSIAKNWLSGFVSGLGAASADIIYSSIAAFSLTFVSDFLIAHETPIGIIGGIFLILLGIVTFSKQAKPIAPAYIIHRNIISDYISAFVLTLTNPMTLLAFMAIFTGLNITSATIGKVSTSFFIGGVFVGSLTWWSTLSIGTGFFATRISYRTLNMINKISGTVIALFGLLVLIKFLF